MKRMTAIALVAAMALIMSGCDALDAVLGYNMLASLAAVDAGEISKADADTLVELSDSDSFYETLEDDAALKDETLTKLDDAIGDTIDSAADQELVVLAANIELQTTPAWDLINNVSSLIVDLLDEATFDESNIEETIRGLVPDSAMSSDDTINEAAFKTMIDALVEANGYYDALGTAIGDDGFASGTGFVAGEIAQNAIVAALVSAVEIPTSYSTANPDAEISDYLYDLLTDSDTAEPESYTAPDMDADSGGSLANILAAAGISFDL